MSRRGSGAAGRRGSPLRKTISRWYAFAALRPRCPAAPLWAALGLLVSLTHPAAAQSDRCVFQINNVDRQGSVVETPQGTNYF
ncbi:MAG TPA: hypothetical protein VGQ24_06165, partial [Gemmatimonadales bacterium]|nr:hypothetical protein [Gemmatimonadales bacterium]